MFRRYDAINLNCGCPSDRVAGSGCFGAALMRDPALTAELCAAMAEGANGTPITVKCRIGVADTTAEALAAGPEELLDGLSTFVDIVSSRSGVRL
jgi:tRNA-dihydrouridine synthase A